MAKNHKKEKCEGCGNDYNLRGLVIVKGKKLCSFCRRKKANLMPQIFPSEIPKSYLPPKLKVREKIIRDIETPKIRGVRKKGGGNKVHLYITSDEKRFLWGKFVKGGMSPEEADKRVDFIVDRMKELAKKIRAEAQKKPITDVQMNQMFLEGLARWSV